MLNELCQLANALDNAGITPKDWHPQLKLLPKVTDKKPCYRITINEDTTITDISELNSELASSLRKWEPSNGNSFPGFNIQPLYRIIDDEQKKKIKSWSEGKEQINVVMIKSWCNVSNNNWDRKVNNKLGKCLNEIPKSLLNILSAIENKRESSIFNLITRIIKYNTSLEDGSCTDNFQTSIENYIWSNIDKTDSKKLLFSLLFHEGASNKNDEEDRGSISVYLDIPDWIDFPVASKDTIDLINRSLLIKSHSSDSLDIIDAFGRSLTGNNDKLPSVKLPIIADVKLRAMNSESLCQYRYGTIDANSFPIGQDSRKRAKGALEWLGDESREGETWGRADNKELIFAYPFILPEMPIKLVSCFGARKSNDSEARFANAAKDVINGLKGISNDLRNLNISIFSLRKMDKARTKVLFHRNYTAQRLADAAQHWESGCSNVPDIEIRTWGKNKGEWQTCHPAIPYPLQIAYCLNRVWKQDGTTECETPIVSITKGIELLLEEQTERFSPHLLSILLQNCKGLLLYLGNSQNKNDVISLKGYDSHKLLVPSILGLLLYKLGYEREDYMANTPFLVGRMLKLADQLHALYCKEVRDNSLPPQLIGNTLMTAALDSPAQALAQLALRIKPYYGWAQTIRKGDNAKLAGYYIKLYGEIASQLATLEIPQRFNDTERAQLFLGYLAANPKKTEKQNDGSNNEKIDIV